jgi:hypothetical protein
MNRRGAAEALNILAHCFRGEGSGRLVQRAKDYLQIVLRIEPNEMFWQGAAEAQPMCDTSTPIVGTHKELLVPEMTLRLDLVQRHC